MTQSGSNEKLRELILYIAAKVEKIPLFGAIKMNKVLFYSDFLWYASQGQSITGLTYQKLDHGPAPRGLLPVQRSLLDDGSAVLVRRSVFNREEKRLVAQRPASLHGLFTPEQIAFVDDIIDSLSPFTATWVSEQTHKHLGWLLSEYGEDIPYYAVFLCDDIALPSDIKRGEELARERGWLKSTAA